MLYKTTSVKRVIAKVFTDNDIHEGDHRIADMIEWAGEALEKIGAFPSLLTKVAGKDDNPLLVVVNYQTKLPCDFHRMVQLSYSSSETGPFYPMRYATGSFDYGSKVNEATVLDITNPETALITVAMDLYDLSYDDALTKINTEPATRSTLNALLTASGTTTVGTTQYIETTTDYTYLITPNYIKTNIETGYIMLAYQAVPTDIDGYPLIPDDQSYLEAIYWYITMKLLYPQWQRGTIRDGIYKDAKSSWNFYCKQAYGNALMPNKDQLESIKNSWLRLVPEINEHSSGFSTLGQRQIIYNTN